MTELHNCPDHIGVPVAFTKSDTDGEVSFAGISTLANPVFGLVLNVNHTYFRLRHQYQK
jgi:hypothetical protein